MPEYNRSALIQTHPILFLVLCFTLWKLLLISVAIASPGPGYDTSTTLPKCDLEEGAIKASSWLDKFVRWDAIYFTRIAHRGVVFEQEWAFGWGFARLLTLVGRALENTAISKQLDAEALAGLLLSHCLHLLSCLMLYQLTWTIYPVMADFIRYKSAIIAASLHIISPAGLFLSAPYAESSFSFFSFTGFYLYAKSIDEHSRGRAGRRDALVVISGLVLGVATTLRGNGLLSGALFGFDALRELSQLRHFTNICRKSRRLGFVIIGGSVMGICAVLPQCLAYLEYCVNLSGTERKRPWCSHRIPSIYAWVQSHYWQVGFLRYWSFSNLPLFALAAPMLLIMIVSSLNVWTLNAKTNAKRVKTKQYKRHVATTDVSQFQYQGLIQSLAIVQMILAVLSLTSYHVQIITRLSSGYPVWYWWLASMIVENRALHMLGREWNGARLVVRWMVVYAFIQGGLFASFLPPA
ncbi:ER membrane glycoprotein subunit of the GPI transamidase complex-like protein [Pseudocyphellaria aurata]|nr:ER membrane glycoprotein subunit of the GPI transamidase complex-like protein [Pseudocyphellaria aurata]